MINPVEELVQICKDNINNVSEKGICSVCSSQSGVLDAAIKQSIEDKAPLLIESTSNQVDQFGGYTGMKPNEFMDWVHMKANRYGYDYKNIILGGDHLGPNRWQNEKASVAMEKANKLVETYVAAGFRKIHLDASMPLGDENSHIDIVTSAERAAKLCATAEKTWKPLFPGDCKPFYVIGTEVPIPGGIAKIKEKLIPTRAIEMEQTRAITREAFSKQGILDAWDRVFAIVVQPGVEYGNNWVSVLDEKALLPLSNAAEKHGDLVYEAHSTDYQKESSLKALVKNHFTILKVGPWVSFAYREGLYALELIEKLVSDKEDLSHLCDILEKKMLIDDKYWNKYCLGSPKKQYIQRHYGLSDRIRYYWSNNEVDIAQDTLFANLNKNKEIIEPGILSQYIPLYMNDIRTDKLSFKNPKAIAEAYTRDVLKIYHRACGFSC